MFNITTNHRKHICHTTSGHPARWNDKTIILFDTFAKELKNKEILQDCKFKLFCHDLNGKLREDEYYGAWIIVDNGYFKWSITITPYKRTANYTETGWSEWMESMRKDVDSTFGILESRWRILKSGI